DHEEALSGLHERALVEPYLDHLAGHRGAELRVSIAPVRRRERRIEGRYDAGQGALPEMRAPRALVEVTGHHLAIDEHVGAPHLDVVLPVSEGDTVAAGLSEHRLTHLDGDGVLRRGEIVPHGSTR